jgi:hypothetical protein
MPYLIPFSVALDFRDPETPRVHLTCDEYADVAAFAAGSPPTGTVLRTLSGEVVTAIENALKRRADYRPIAQAYLNDASAQPA